MKYGLIGEHLPHSFSKEIHAQIAAYPYEIKELAPSELDAFFTQKEFDGLNVTIPYKQAVIPYLSEIGERARVIGAINTVIRRGELLYGDNTDFYGMRALLHTVTPTLSGKKVLILGTGGTSRTARAVAEAENARETVTVSRTRGDNCVSYEDAYTYHTDADAIINTTPCGMFPYPDGGEGRKATPIDLSRFPMLSCVVDAIYNPLRTNLVLDAQERGIPASGGLFMLAAQALQASLLFRGLASNAETEPSAEEATRIYRAVECMKENVVLIGMPASGKSTVGALLSEELHRPFIDTDKEIERKTGRTIPDIFEKDGEQVFRNIESEVITECAMQSGAIIATGGGAILREGNLRALKRNGRLYFLDRPLPELMPTSDRPLSQTRDALESRYKERYPRYLSACDVRIHGQKTANDAVNAIKKDYFR